MKLLLWLCCLSFFLISCGDRHAADISGNGFNHYQKPDGDGSWSTVTDATVIDDHQVYFMVERSVPEGFSTSFQVFADDKDLSLKAFVGDMPVMFGSIKCLQMGAVQCVSYEVESYFGSKFRVTRRADMQVKVITANSERQLTYATAILQQQERGHTWEYLVAQKPNEMIIHWVAGSIWLPDFTSSMMALGVGLTGPLKESTLMYKFEGMTYEYFMDRTVMKGSFRHLLSKEVEVVAWELRSGS